MARTPFVLGIDGSRGKWLVCRLDDASVEFGLIELAEIGRCIRGEAAAVAIDIPIGLPSELNGRRECDRLARQHLTHRKSSVFNAPSRPVLAFAGLTYTHAREQFGGKLPISAQAWGLVKR